MSGFLPWSKSLWAAKRRIRETVLVWAETQVVEEDQCEGKRKAYLLDDVRGDHRSHISFDSVQLGQCVDRIVTA